MKKTTIVTLSLLTTLMFGSCSKKQNTSTGKDTKMKLITSPTFTYYDYGKDILEGDFLDNKDDAEDEKFNYVNHAMTLGLLEISKNPTLLAALVSEIDAKPAKQLDLFDYADNNTGVDAIFNQIFSERFDDFSSFDNDWRAYVNAKYVYDTTYRPFARFINQTSIDVEEVPYYSEPFDIDEGKFPTFNNNLPLWITNEDGFLFSTINEEMSYLIHNPIIAIVNGHPGDDEITQLAPANGIRYNGGYTWGLALTSCELNPLPTWHVHESIVHTKFKLSYAYEGGDNNLTEYWTECFFFEAYKSSPVGWNTYGAGHEAQRGREYQISKSQLNTLIDYEFQVFGPDQYDSPACIDLANLVSAQNTLHLDRYFLFAAYERDWGNTGKFIGGVYKNNNATGYEAQYGNRKYDDEWYFINPTINWGYPFTTQTGFPLQAGRNATPNSVYTNTTKGELRLERQYD